MNFGVSEELEPVNVTKGEEMIRCCGYVSSDCTVTM